MLLSKKAPQASWADPHPRAYRAVRRLIQWLFPPLFRLLYGWRVVGAGHLLGLPGGAVTVCNHIHPLDCVMLACAFPQRRLFYLSLPDNLRLPVAGPLVRLLGAVPVPSTPSGYRQLYSQAAARLAQGQVMQIYPEGSRQNGCPVLRPFKPGAFSIAVRLGVPVVPCVLRPRAGRAHSLELAVLPPIYPPQGGLPPRAAARVMEQAAYACMTAALEETRGGCAARKPPAGAPRA